ncbi:MAG: valine--tRNA ligase [Bdellovibrionota bacterium]
MPQQKLAKAYEPENFEKKWYEFWESNDCFSASDKNATGQQAFSMVIPPPNVTGALHIGHALTCTIQDILIRWRRMHGDNTLWLPGTDHAGIATQAQVEKAIANEGKSSTGKPLTRHDLGRDAFLARAWRWKEEHSREITNQLKRLGSSLDWKRERFTMDEGLSAAVREVFVRLYEDGLVYRGERITNWCPRCHTALSDLEVIPKERKGHLWYISYKIVDDAGAPVCGTNGEPIDLVIATTRPETMLGDTAVAVHPDDERYKTFHGKKVKLPIIGRLIPIICDPYVDREFGTGALKITPAHDFNDYELGCRHGLTVVSVMGKDGRITPAGGPFSGMRFAEARELVLQQLRESRLLIKTEDHVHKVGLCQRCENVAEPIISKQWFVKIESLAKPAIEAVKDGRISFAPKNWEKTYFEWMYNIRDWCISRQLWWGHQIPAWYCGRCQETTVASHAPAECTSCKAPASELKQDEDVLDTWFSSALWPFSTLGWPEKTQALETFYPTSILETGFDIIFFWVARMIMMGLRFMGDVPFRKVYLHAMVRDEKGEKMSKSKGNVIDPLVVMNKYGTDSLRFTLAAMAGQGRDIKLSVGRVDGYKAFCNKLWNATKFFHLQFEQQGFPAPPTDLDKWVQDHYTELSMSSRWIISRLQATIATVEQGLRDFELNNSAQALYDFTWYEFCDWYIELSKLSFKKQGADQVATAYAFHYVLETLLKLLHPFIPFVSEELWQSLPWISVGIRAGEKPPVLTIMLKRFPVYSDSMTDRKAELEVTALKRVVEVIRNFRGENNISQKVVFPVAYVASSAAGEAFLKHCESEILSLANIARLQKAADGAEVGNIQSVIPLHDLSLELRITLDGLVDVAEESKRLKKEIEKVDSDIAHIKKKLSQESFVSKAPQELVAKEREREKEFSNKRIELQASLERILTMAQVTRKQDGLN